MLKQLYLSAALALGLSGCKSSVPKLEDIILHADINQDGKEDIIRLRRSEGLKCDDHPQSGRKSPPGVYVLLGLGNSHADGHPVYNICEIPVWDLAGLGPVGHRLGKLEVTDYNKDGRLDIVYTSLIRDMYAVAFLNRYGDAHVWDTKLVRHQ